MTDDRHRDRRRAFPRWLRWLFRGASTAAGDATDAPGDVDVTEAPEPDLSDEPHVAEGPPHEGHPARPGFLSRLVGRRPRVDAEPDLPSEDRPEIDAPAASEAPGAPSGEPVRAEPCVRLRTPKPGLFPIREHLHPAVKWALSLLPFILFTAWWFWATAGSTPELRHISSRVLPSPYEVASRCAPLWYESALMRNILLSLGRVLGGFTIAAAIALPLGIAMASFGRVGATFGLVATLLSYVPMPAIVPLTYAWWKTGEEQKIGFLALVTFAYLLPLIVRHVNAVDHKYLLSAYSQGASSWQTVRKVLVPIALPGIVDALRLCLGVGWTYIVLAEVIKSGESLGGVGNLIMVSYRFGRMEEVYLTVAAIVVVGAIMDRTCVWVGNWLFPYRMRPADE